MAPEVKKRFCVATPPSWMEYKTCRALAVPSGLLFAYNANAIVDKNKVGTAGRKKNMFLQLLIADHVVIVIVQCLERAWQCSEERLENMLDFNPEWLKVSVVFYFRCRQV